jgi:glyoxylase-like metal-dependent hydrolase (beta-lactamase superfamily II)
LHEIGNGVFAYLQPDGGMGLSNAGLLVDGKRSVVVDTLMDLPLTQEMLSTMRRATPAAETIDVLINTHANLDHTFGNQLVADAEIISSAACAEEMMEQNQIWLDHFRNWQTRDIRATPSQQLMARFNFDDIVITPPTRTFHEKRIAVPLGNRVIDVIQVGPAHTRGDVIAYSPSDRIVFAGDILFIGVHPVIWVGPWNGWIEACELILGLDVDVVVPGHGPITDKAGVQVMLDWISYLRDESKARYDAGLSVEETVRSIALYPPIADWIEPERIVNNVNLLFGEFGGREFITDTEQISAIQGRMIKE